MRLLRLITEDKNANFDNIFYDSLTLEPNSKIALQSLSMDTVENELEVDSANDEIQYQISSGFTKTIILNTELYTSINYQDLLNDITLKLNNNSGFIHPPNVRDNRELGIEWLASVNQQSKVNIQYKLATYSEHPNMWKYDNTLVQNTQQNGRSIWSQIPNTSDDGNERSMIFNTYLSRGNSFVRGRINNITQSGVQPDENGYIIGLSTVDIAKLSNKELTSDMLTYGIAVYKNTATANEFNYATVLNGVYTPNVLIGKLIGDNNIKNDFQEIMKNYNTIEFNVYQTIDPLNDAGVSPIPINLLTVDYNTSGKLYPFVVFRSDNASINSIRLTPSPFVAPNPALDTENDFSESLSVPSYPSRRLGQNFMLFPNSVAEFLGYTSDRKPQALNQFYNTVIHDYIADEKLNFTDSADAYIVELQNIKLDSYDGYQNQRKNIIAIIPKSNIEGSVIYEVNNLIFIDLNNKEPLLLRNLKARIVKQDYSQVEVNALTSMVLLIDN